VGLREGSQKRQKEDGIGRPPETLYCRGLHATSRLNPIKALSYEAEKVQTNLVELGSLIRGPRVGMCFKSVSVHLEPEGGTRTSPQSLFSVQRNTAHVLLTFALPHEATIRALRRIQCLLRRFCLPWPWPSSCMHSIRNVNEQDCLLGPLVSRSLETFTKRPLIAPGTPSASGWTSMDHLSVLTLAAQM
jgi:hypothetical protein